MHSDEHNGLRAARRVGRPRRGTEGARADGLIEAATRVFLREGYGSSSIDKVASEAGVSTRTIYERFKNKADLLGAVITRLVDRDMAVVLSPGELARFEPLQALTIIGRAITDRASNADATTLFRILATEAQRFPELAAKMRESTKARIDNAVEIYFRGQIARGALTIADPARAASLFMQMICAELNQCLLFGSASDIANLDFKTHVGQVVDIFLNGTLPRAEACTVKPANP